MTQDRSAQRFFAGQPGQAKMVDEGLHTNDRIMSPIIALPSLPEIQSLDEHGAVGARGKLENPAEQAAPAHRHRWRLHDTHGGMLFHQTNQIDERPAGHYAV